jgi:hypothetical protein
MVRRADSTRQAEPPASDASAARIRALALLAVTSAIGGSGLATGGTAGALLGAQLAGTNAAAGLPLGLLVLGRLLAMQKVVGSSPISRLEVPANRRFSSFLARRLRY